MIQFMRYYVIWLLLKRNVHLTLNIFYDAYWDDNKEDISSITACVIQLMSNIIS